MEPLKEKATDLDYLLATLQTFKTYHVMSNSDLARKAITKYERGIRDLQEDFDMLQDCFTDEEH